MIQLLTVTKFTFYNKNPNIHKKCNHIIRLNWLITSFPYKMDVN